MQVVENAVLRIEVAIPLNEKTFLAICDLKDDLLNNFGGLTHSTIISPFDDDEFEQKVPFSGLWINVDEDIKYDEKVVRFICYIDHIKYPDWRKILDEIADKIVKETDEDAVLLLCQEAIWLIYY